MSVTDGAHEFEEQRTILDHAWQNVRRRREGEQGKKKKKKKKKKGRGAGRGRGVCNHTNTTRSHIGGNHNRALASFEFAENPVSFSLLLVAVNR